jgi:hypothetical protein
MKFFLGLFFNFLVLFAFGQSVSIREFNHTTNSLGSIITSKNVLPGDTLTFEIAIVEDLINDFSKSPIDGGGYNVWRGLSLITQNNDPAIPIIGTYKEKVYDIEFLADSNILAIHDSSITNPGASGSFSLTGKFEVDSLNHFDSIAFKYVHIVTPIARICNPCALSKNQTIPTFNLKKQKEFNIC